MSTRINHNDVLENSDLKPTDKAVSNTLYGFNHSDKLPVLESNHDVRGHVFFTRPQLNLTTTNIRNVRQMYSLLSNRDMSMHRYVRTMLDPRLQYGLDHPLYNNEQLDCPLTDRFNPFIPVLSNTLMTMSGWPDMVAPTFTSKAGLRKEQISMIDGTFEIYDSFDIDCTFKNFINEPLTLMFQTWIQYASLVFEGMLYPYIDFILENEFDYNTRIYRFITDKSGRRIKKASITGAAFPASVPTGKFFDFDRTKPLSEATGEINIKFKAMGAMYNDDIIFKEFNSIVATFNPDVRAWLAGDKDKMEIIPYEILPLLNFRGYPVVNIESDEWGDTDSGNELIWLINKDSKSYKRIIALSDGTKQDKLDDLIEEQVDELAEEESDTGFSPGPLLGDE